MFKKGLEVRPQIGVTLIIDTGADSTMLSSQLMRSLGIEPTGQTRLLTSGSKGVPEPCNVYDIQLEIANRTQPTWRIPALEVLALPLENQGTDGMLGRDVLRLGILHYDGPRNQFTLDY
jgi:predicted aspartyl protease